jgi:transcriptional regulator GlxA family with amidase domain
VEAPDLESRRGILDPDAAARHFRLTRYAPSEDLAHLVDRHWVVAWSLEQPYTQEVVTHPSFHMVFEPDADLIYGVVTQRFRRQLSRSGIAVATKFRPGGFHPFHPVPAHTLTDRTIPVSDVFAPMAIEGDELQRIAAMEAGMRAKEPEDDPRVAEIGELYAAMLRGPRTVGELGALAGYSKRTLQRLFREYVGVSPKWVLQRVRLHEAADRMADGEHDWPRLALELGYFDQAHFIKAFKAAIGRSPADYGLKTSTT